MAKARVDEAGERKGEVAVVKKYANRRLYNTASSSYVTLEDLAQMVREGRDFAVSDARTGEDITRSVLTQIILEEDAKGRNLLPIGFLRQLIGFYDDQLHAFLPRYLELSMENFARHQDQIRAFMEQTVGRFFPLSQFEDMTRQNLALFQNAATMFSPFRAESEGGQTPEPPSSNGETQPVRDQITNEMRELKGQLEQMQRQLEALSRKSS